MRPWVEVALLALCTTLCACGGGSKPASSTVEPGFSAPPGAQTDPGTSMDTGREPIASPAATQIDLLAVVAASVRDVFDDPALRVQHVVNVMNGVMSDNGVPIEVRITDVLEVDYPDGFDAPTALDHLSFETYESLIGVSQARDAAGADLVVLFRPYANDGYCGFAWIGGFRQDGDFSRPENAELGYSVVATDCSDYTLIHELGHNLGLAHSRREAPEGGTYPYSVGFGIDNDFVTIMASSSAFNAVQLPRLSSPHSTCNGQPCGVSTDDPENGADAVQTLATTAGQVAGYR